MRNKVQPPTGKVDDQGSCHEINSLRRGSGYGLILRRILTTLRKDQGRSPDIYTGPLWMKEGKISAK